MTIWKFPFEVEDHVVIPMPGGAQILSVQIQHGQPFVWALVNDANDVERRRFRVYGTGHPCQSPANRFVGTFQMAGGALVFHLFEDRP